MEILASGMLPLLFLQGFPDFATAAAAAAMGQQGFTPSTTTATTSPGLRRAVFTDAQRQELERAFRQHAYITKLERKTLAERLGLRDAQVGLPAPSIPPPLLSMTGNPLRFRTERWAGIGIPALSAIFGQ
ncbi:hypothetical protein AAHC03_040 [Spirometra sp. Aus1]